MKSAEDWADETWSYDDSDTETQMTPASLVRAIQADALRWAQSKIADGPAWGQIGRMIDLLEAAE